MGEISDKSPLLFEFFEIRKSKHSRSYVSLFIMRKNKNEQDLARKSTLDLTLIPQNHFSLINAKCILFTNRTYCLLQSVNICKLQAGSTVCTTKFTSVQYLSIIVNRYIHLIVKNAAVGAFINFKAGIHK